MAAMTAMTTRVRSHLRPRRSTRAGAYSADDDAVTDLTVVALGDALAAYECRPELRGYGHLRTDAVRARAAERRGKRRSAR